METLAVSVIIVNYNGMAYKLASLCMLFIISMNVVLAPRVAALHNRGKMGELHKTLRKITHIIIGLTIPLIMLIILLSNYLLALFGHGFTGGRQALIIISIGFLLNAITGNVDQILNMTGNQKILQNITMAGFALNVLLNLVLIPRYGINAAATASLLTNVLFNAACIFYIKKKLGFYTFI
ncbi:lipopolysaccharide biosynthesis protein [Flavobacterium sp. RHBU_24]|uniref:lipopolysaccharide biosynthesis protein n=1 Tax=Flavobacterium sp. RHBU_24 TaxID=3391185 RepID=UPI003984D710